MDFINEKSKSGNYGFHISGIVCGRKINFSLDSGSTASILSAEYRKLPPEISHYCKTCNHVLR